MSVVRYMKKILKQYTMVKMKMIFEIKALSSAYNIIKRSIIKCLPSLFQKATLSQEFVIKYSQKPVFVWFEDYNLLK